MNALDTLVLSALQSFDLRGKIGVATLRHSLLRLEKPDNDLRVLDQICTTRLHTVIKATLSSLRLSLCPVDQQVLVSADVSHDRGVHEPQRVLWDLTLVDSIGPTPRALHP